MIFPSSDIIIFYTVTFLILLIIKLLYAAPCFVDERAGAQRDLPKGNQMTPRNPNNTKGDNKTKNYILVQYPRASKNVFISYNYFVRICLNIDTITRHLDKTLYLFNFKNIVTFRNF
jgi:hypothetical protein